VERDVGGEKPRIDEGFQVGDLIVRIHTKLEEGDTFMGTELQQRMLRVGVMDGVAVDSREEESLKPSGARLGRSGEEYVGGPRLEELLACHGPGHGGHRHVEAVVVAEWVEGTAFDCRESGNVISELLVDPLVTLLLFLLSYGVGDCSRLRH